MPNQAGELRLQPKAAEFSGARAALSPTDSSLKREPKRIATVYKLNTHLMCRQLSQSLSQPIGWQLPLHKGAFKMHDFGSQIGLEYKLLPEK